MPKKQATAFLQKFALISLGVFLFLVSLEIGLRAYGALFLYSQEFRNISSITQKGSYRIMCLGESTTVLGFGEDSYPIQLEKILNQSNIGIRFSVINKGVVGVDTSAILEHLGENLNKYKPDMVVTMMGVNDMNTNLLGGGNIIAQRVRIFLKDLRVYKLANLLWSHIAAKKDALERDKQFYFSLNREFINKAMKAKTRDFKTSLFLARFYRSEKNFPEAEKLYKEAIALRPGKGRIYQEVGWLYEDNGNYLKTEELLKKAIQVDPRNYRTYLDLGWFYRSRENYSQAEAMFKKAIELNPKEEMVYIELSWLYNCQGKSLQAEDAFKKALKLTLSKRRKTLGLGVFYENGIQNYQTAIGGLGALYTEMNNHEYAREYYRKADELRLKYLNPVTRYNYRKLKETLDKKNITLVCAQYPVRSVELLKKIFEGETGVVFVDNEKIFKDMIKKEGYNEYFNDLFAGDFGHCTLKGNRLLAGNIARVILKECFNK